MVEITEADWLEGRDNWRERYGERPSETESAQDEAQQYAEQAEEKDALVDLQRRYGNGPTRRGGTA